ncbi:MAG: type II toxin-antitoxin system HicB family antitoxin [Patescibacteria group bacterium]
MNYKFTSIINKEGRWYVARCIELGVVSQGKTIEESQKNLQEAMELFLESRPEIKKQLPKTAPLIAILELNHV